MRLVWCPGKSIRVALTLVAQLGFLCELRLTPAIVSQAWIGGECVYVLLCAIFPSTANIPNGIPNSGTDTGHFLGFFLFSALSLVAIWYPLHQVGPFHAIRILLD